MATRHFITLQTCLQVVGTCFWRVWLFCAGRENKGMKVNAFPKTNRLFSILKFSSSEWFSSQQVIEKRARIWSPQKCVQCPKEIQGNQVLAMEKLPHYATSVDLNSLWWYLGQGGQLWSATGFALFDTETHWLNTFLCWRFTFDNSPSRTEKILASHCPWLNDAQRKEKTNRIYFSFQQC